MQNNVPKVQTDLGFGDGIGVLVNQFGDLCKVSKGRQQSKQHLPLSSLGVVRVEVALLEVGEP